ncbi:phage tail tape measure protein [Paenibacillus sp. FSL R5-0475]|uniref:phage tail tape measure protein n=1 Tax=Paenibacillus sp. FSL R5-0475 TaxID=2921643 RepID=UPI0030F75755
MAGRSREYDIAFRLNGLMDPSFRQSMGNAERHIEELERALREMSRRGDLDDVRRDADRADDSLRNLRDSAGGFNDTLRQVAEYTGAFALIQGAAGGMQNIVGIITDQSDAMAQLQAATGVTAEEMLAMKDSAESLYNDRLGEDFNDLGSALATVRQVSQASGAELEKMTKNAIVFRDVFGEDITQSIKASDTMMRNFRITSEQSYNLLAQGAQEGLNKSDELIDTANEYSVYFDTLGYSAEEMFNQFAAGLDAGAFNLDKVGDAVKEFGIRIKDGSDSTYEAMSILFAPDDIEDFTQKLMKGSSKSAEYMELLKHVSKDTAAQLVKDLKNGGKKSASAYQTLQGIMGKGNDILGGLADGSVKGKDAMQQVIEKLNDIEDPILKSTIGVALFGTQFEDMESGVIAALGTAREQFDMTKATMEEVAKVKYDTLSKDFQAVGRQLMTELVIPIGEDLMPALQEFADWMGENSDLLKVIALAAPAALIGKSVSKIVKGFGSITSAANGAGGAAGGFGRALALLTNPVGIAVTSVGLITAGVIAYKKHQENARQEVLHMADALEGAYSNYAAIDEASNKTKDLITEYDRLNAKIKNAKTPADELTEARRKMKNVEQELIDMNSDILSAEDLKSGKFREQAGLLESIYDTREKLSKRDLEHAALEAEGNLPTLEKDYSRYKENLKKQNEFYAQSKENYSKYIKYVEQHKGIYDDIPVGDQRDEALKKLASKIQDETGKNYTGFWQELQSDYKAIEKSFDDYRAKIQATEGDIAEAEASFMKYYTLQVQMIENDLGGSIDELAKKYKTASDTEKKRFDDATRLISQLNDEVNLLPAQKKIDLQLIWQQTGQVPDFNTPEGKKIKYLSLRDPGFEGYAEGGVATKPSIFAEAGPEIAIPLNNKPRSRSLLDMANDLMGYTKNENREGDIIIHNAPVITLPGADPSVMKLVKEALKQSEDSLERKLKAIVEQQRRVSFQ